MFPSRIFLAVCLSSAVICTGCSGGMVRKTGKVSGKIELDGVPLSDVVIVFEDAAQGFGASTAVNDGVYQFETPLVVGDYKVTIQPPPAPAPTAAASAADSPSAEIPKQYLNASDTDLEASVQEGANTFDFELKP